MKNTITREKLRKCGACYTGERIDALVPVCGVTALDVANSTIPLADIVWVLTRPGVCSDKLQRLFAVRCARRALARVKDPDPRGVAACDVAERFAHGKATKDELESAQDAYAADAQHAYDAYAAAAAYLAADASAAYAAYRAAAASAADRAEERSVQVTDLIELLLEETP